MNDYGFEAMIAGLAMTLGLLTGGYITSQTHHWGYGLLVTLGAAMLFWAVLGIARSEPVTAAEADSPLGVLK